QVLLRDDILIADELGEVRGDLPDPVLEVQHHRELVGRLDAVEVVPEEGRRAATRVRLEVLLDRELDVFRRQLTPALVKLHPGPELECPRPQLVRWLPLRAQPRAI